MRRKSHFASYHFFNFIAESEYRMTILDYKPITPKEHNDMAHTYDWLLRYGCIGNATEFY